MEPGKSENGDMGERESEGGLEEKGNYIEKK